MEGGRSRRRIAVVTVSRADWGPLRPVVRALAADPRTEPLLVVTGGHLSPGQGRTVSEIVAEGLHIDARVELPSRDAASQTGAATTGLARVYRELGPDAVLVLGDRFETLGAASAALVEGVPLAHVHGGEVTEGALDNQVRYAVTAMASLHLVATARARARLIAMGEPAERVVLTGAPGLDDVAGFEPMPRRELLAAAGLGEGGPFVLVTVHPETIGDRRAPARLAEAVIEGVRRVGVRALVTGTNADPGGEAVGACLREAAARLGWPFRVSLGPGVYRSAMAHAVAMVGNSSSGIIEAASLGLPVVNVGCRQAGRERSANVIDAAGEATAVEKALKRAIAGGRGPFDNVYGDGRASERIVEALATVSLGPGGRRKPFEPPAVQEPGGGRSSQ